MNEPRITTMSSPLWKALATGYQVCLESESYNPGQVREATREEYDRACTSIAENEVTEYYPGLTPEEHAAKVQSFLADNDRVWNCHLHAYTYDGNQMLVTVPNKDGSSYIFLAYIEPTKRGTGLATMVMKKCIADHPEGLSLHTNKENRLVRGLCKHFGFSEYPSRIPDKVFMANKPGIGGEEWRDDPEQEKSNGPELT